jgi:membrane protease YdiL (CAAX protease family)
VDTASWAGCRLGSRRDAATGTRAGAEVNAEVKRMSIRTRPPRRQHSDPPPGARAGSWVRAHPFAAYVAAAYAISWTLWAPAVVGAGGPVVLVLFFVGVFGPAAAAAWVVYSTGGPPSLRRWARQVVRWRVPLRYYAYALGLPAALFAVVNLELAVLGREVDLSLLPDRLGAYATTFLLVATIGGGFEEPGWRGFALPHLQGGHTPIRATLLLGGVWALWHLPLYGLGFVGPLLFVFFYTWLYNKTGSVLLCILLHGSFTPALDHLVLTADDLAVDLTIVATLAAGALALVALTRGRLGYDPVAAADPGTTPPSGRPGPAAHPPVPAP